MNTGAAKGREEMAVPATTANETSNSTPGSPPASAVAAAAAADNDNDEDDDKDDGVDLDARRRVRDLRCMLDASVDHLANAKTDAALVRVECARTLELAKRRAGEKIWQIEEELRRTALPHTGRGELTKKI